ncbi:MAG: hypothetical protein ACP5C3_04535 [Methanomicrobiales archaeon]
MKNISLVKMTPNSLNNKFGNCISLESIWGSNYIIYKDIPLKNIFNLKNIHMDEVNINLNDYIIDFTVFDKNATPLLLLDFVLWNPNKYQGFVNFHKISKNEIESGLEIKCKILVEQDTLYNIISFEDPYLDINGKNTDNNDQSRLLLNIVNSIIGEKIIKKDIRGFLENLVEDLGANLNDMDDKEKKVYLDDLIADSKLVLKWDPLEKEVEKIQDRLAYEGIIKSETKIPLAIPELPKINDFQDKVNLNRRRKIFQQSRWIGCKICLRTKKINIEKEAWIKNSKNSGKSSLKITEYIARFLAYSEIAGYYKIKI